MAPVPESAFRDMLGSCSRAAFARFVADLWAARGREVALDGDRVVVDGDRVLVPVVDAGARPAAGDGDPDVVVSATPVDDPDVVGPTELRHVLLYDVPRDRAGDLFRTHFGRELDGEWHTGGHESADGSPTAGSDAGVEGPRSPGGGSDGDESDGDEGDDRRADAATRATPDGERAERRLPPWTVERSSPVLAAAGLAVVVLAVLVTAAFAAGPGAGLLAGGAPTATPTVTSAVSGEAPDGGPPISDPPDADIVVQVTPTPATDYPPGVSAGGVHDAGVLGKAHARGVMGRSYELTITYREYREGTLTGAVRETIRVRDRTVYVTDVAVLGELVGEPRAVSTAETYADGSIRYERRVQDGDAVYTVRDAQALRGGESPFAGRVERLVRTRLSAQETRVVGRYRRENETHFLVLFRGEGRAGAARVGEDGVVHALRWRRTLADHPGVTATVIVRLEFGNVTVAPPPWVAQARNATLG